MIISQKYDSAGHIDISQNGKNMWGHLLLLLITIIVINIGEF